MKTYDKLRARASSNDLLFPGHDPIMSEKYPEVAEGVTRLVLGTPYDEVHSCQR